MPKALSTTSLISYYLFSPARYSGNPSKQRCSSYTISSNILEAFIPLVFHAFSAIFRIADKTKSQRFVIAGGMVYHLKISEVIDSANLFIPGMNQSPIFLQTSSAGVRSLFWSYYNILLLQHQSYYGFQSGDLPTMLPGINVAGVPPLMGSIWI